MNIRDIVISPSVRLHCGSKCLREVNRTVLECVYKAHDQGVSNTLHEIKLSDLLSLSLITINHCHGNIINIIISSIVIMSQVPNHDDHLHKMTLPDRPTFWLSLFQIYITPKWLPERPGSYYSIHKTLYKFTIYFTHLHLSSYNF